MVDQLLRERERELDLKTYRMGITSILNNFVFDMRGLQ